MLKSFLSVLDRTRKSRFGIVEAVITASGAIGHSLGADKVNRRVSVAGLGLFPFPALWELAKSHRPTVVKDSELTAATKRAWHFEQERDQYRQMVSELEQRWILQQPLTTGPFEGAAGDVNQRTFHFDDPHQLIFLPLQEGRHRTQGFRRADDASEN